MEDNDDKILTKIAAILNTQPENVMKTIERFLKEIYEKQKE
jgi:transposase-like protein